MDNKTRAGLSLIRHYERADFEEAAYDVIERRVRAEVAAPITDQQAGALTSLVVSIGLDSLRGSTLLRLLRDGDVEGAAAQFARWAVVGGVVVEVLAQRRQAETDLFRS